MNKRPAKIVEVGGLTFRAIGFHNHFYWLNIEPASGTHWRIVGFRDRDSGFSILRLHWTRNGTWVDAREKEPESLFEWKELDAQVQLALANKPKGMAGIESTKGPWPDED